MTVSLVFSWFADPGAWPEHPGSGSAVVDSAVFGPMRTLDLLETMLGLGAPAAAGVKRIAVYRHKLESAGAGRFWAQSFAADSWSTARELLNWRDELVEAGWQSEAPISPERLSDLAAAERSGPALPAGLADRLRLVIEALRDKRKLPLASIELVDARDELPTGWRRLLQALEGCGVEVGAKSAAAPERSASDLSRLLASFGADGARPQITGDGTVCVLTADAELVAAEAVAAWLAADKSDNEDLVFVLGKDSSLLDHALHRVGLPRLGASAASPHRALMQILPLAFALAWDPPDPRGLLDFLLLPTSPLPRWASRMLALRVAETPGVGGPLWLKTFDEIAERFVERAPDEPAAKRAETISGWRAFVEPERHDPIVGMPRAAAGGIASRLAAWATSRYGTSEDSLFLALATAASDLAAAIEATEAERLDRLLIERMIEQVVGAGVADPAALAEAAPWRAVAHPGAIWGAADTVIWWHFADNGEVGQRTVWDAKELNALAAAGCPLEDPALAIRRVAAAWERPLRQARKKLILVRPAVAGSQEVKTHPLWHSLVAGRRGVEERVGIRAEVILKEAAPQFAGRVLSRQKVEPAAPTRRRSEWSAPADAISARTFESATSLSSLLSCPLRWTLQYAAGLRSSPRQSLADGDAMFGSLAHKIAEGLFLPGAPPDPKETVKVASARLEELLPEMAATLLLPGAARELSAAREAIPEALGELARFLHANRLNVVATEQTFEDGGSLGADTGVAGAIDLLAQDRAGGPVVIDLKWQRTDKYRRQEIANGVAVQLAVYAKHVGGAKQDVATGYFMLQQKRFVTGSPQFKEPVVHVEGESPGETWQRVSASWQEAMKEMAAGKVRATFDQDGASQDKFNDPFLLTPPRCEYCDCNVLCGRA